MNVPHKVESVTDLPEEVLGPLDSTGTRLANVHEARSDYDLMTPPASSAQFTSSVSQLVPSNDDQSARVTAGQAVQTDRPDEKRQAVQTDSTGDRNILSKDELLKVSGSDESVDSDDDMAERPGGLEAVFRDNFGGVPSADVFAAALSDTPGTTEADDESSDNGTDQDVSDLSRAPTPRGGGQAVDAIDRSEADTPSVTRFDKVGNERNTQSTCL